MRLHTFTSTLLCTALVAATATAQDAAIPTAGLELWVKADGPIKVVNGQVSEWTDASGAGNHAAHDAFGLDMPTVANANGRPTLHFSGGYTGFHFNKLNDVRTLFAVLSKDSTSCLPTLPNYGTPAKFWLGGNDNPTYFHPEHGCSIYNGNLSEVSPNLVNGKTYLNGKLVDGRVTRFPFTLGIVSIVSTANVAADTIARDRNFKDRSWQGDISELLIYNRALDDATRVGIQNALSLKYAVQVEGGPAIGAGGSAGASGSAGMAGSAGAGGTVSAGGTAGAVTGGAGSSSGGASGGGGTPATVSAAGASGGGHGPGVAGGGSEMNANSASATDPSLRGCSCSSACQKPGDAGGDVIAASFVLLAVFRRRRNTRLPGVEGPAPATLSSASRRR